MANKNLNRDTVRLLRKIQKFLIAEPRRFNMMDGVSQSYTKVGKIFKGVAELLEEPPCGTACCIAGAGYVIDKGISLNATSISWGQIDALFETKYRMTERQRSRLFFTRHLVSLNEPHWPDFYSDAYEAAKTPLERACVGVARIEHFITTDGRE